jgi:hypothetical protein
MQSISRLEARAVPRALDFGLMRCRAAAIAGFPPAVRHRFVPPRPFPPGRIFRFDAINLECSGLAESLAGAYLSASARARGATKADRPAAVVALEEPSGGLMSATKKLRGQGQSLSSIGITQAARPPEGDENAHRYSHHSPSRDQRQMGTPPLRRVSPNQTNVTSVTCSSHSSANTPAVARDVPNGGIPCSMPISKSHIVQSP